MKNHIGCLALMSALVTVIVGPVYAAGVTLYEKDGKYVKVGGRIQMQYHREDPDNGSAEDDMFFRRLRPYIEGSIHPDWKGKFQLDYGKAEDGNEVAIKDAYMEYSGLHNIKIKIGNANFPFSREKLTSSKKQQLVERTFVGDHNYGTPDRNLGIHASGHNVDKRVTWGAAVAASYIDPSSSKLDFDTPVNRNSDFNEGWIGGGRIDFHPWGNVKFSQGDFSRQAGATIGVAAFVWGNDDDNNGHPASIDDVTGLEISSALRGMGFSVDAEYNYFDVDTVDSSFTGGLYKDGETELENWAIEGGYMVVSDKLELVLAYQSQDADNYDNDWTRFSAGANWFIAKHDIKVQLSYRANDSVNGVSGDDEDEIFVQTQFVF